MSFRQSYTFYWRLVHCFNKAQSTLFRTISFKTENCKLFSFSNYIYTTWLQKCFTAILFFYPYGRHRSIGNIEFVHVCNFVVCVGSISHLLQMTFSPPAAADARLETTLSLIIVLTSQWQKPLANNVGKIKISLRQFSWSALPNIKQICLLTAKYSHNFFRH